MKQHTPRESKLIKRQLVILATVTTGIAGCTSIANAFQPLPIQLSQQIPVPIVPPTNQPLPHAPQFEFRKPTNIWAWANPQLIRTLEGHLGRIDSLIFSPDGEILISGGSTNDAQIKFWRLKTGKAFDSIRAQRSSVVALALSPDGETLVSSGIDSGVNLWNWKTGNYDRIFLEHSSNVLSLAITPDSQTLVTGALDGIRVWDLKRERPIYTLARFDNLTYALAISPNGDTLASGHKFGTIKLWNLKTGRLVGKLSGHAGPVSSLAFTPDGQTLVSGSYDRTIKVWNLRSGKPGYTLSGHTGRVQEIAINPDGETLASTSRDGVRLWNLKTRALLTLLTAHRNWVQSVAFSRDGRLLATGGFDQTIKIWQGTSLPEQSPPVHQVVTH